MLEHLSPREFEEYCQLLFACLYRCNVELTKQTGDEGRDLLVHRSSGLEVVECKHWPNGTVGRPVVQKLHSAVLTANSNRGVIITTGRFSNDAETYAQSLNDVTIELIGAAKLAHMISLAFPNGELPATLSAAIRTTPDTEFPQVFFQSILSKDRFHTCNATAIPVRVTRATEYEAFFIGTYHATGLVNTAVGEYSESWDGAVWINGNGDNAGFGSPRSQTKGASFVPLAEVLRTVAGKSAPPKLQPHQAVAGMKAYIATNCAKEVWYRGRNNVSYSAVIQPTLNSVRVASLKICYVPYQEFQLALGGVCYQGDVEESGSPTQFHVTCPALSQCSVCGTATKPHNQIFCSICFRPAHRWSILSPDSFQCNTCSVFVCRNHTVRVGARLSCTRCGPGGHALGVRWLGHFMFGLGVFTLTAVVTLMTILVLLYSGAELTQESTLSVLSIGGIVGLMAWVPYVAIILQARLSPKCCALTYPRLDIENASKKPQLPEWLYGRST